MKLPHKIRVTASQAYEIVFVDRFENLENLGECRFHSKQIALNKNQSKTEMEKTVIHELLHAVEFEHNITIPHETIYALEVALHKVLKLNGWLK